MTKRIKDRIKSMGFGVRPGFKSWIYNLLTVRLKCLVS